MAHFTPVALSTTNSLVENLSHYHCMTRALLCVWLNMLDKNIANMLDKNIGLNTKYRIDSRDHDKKYCLCGKGFFL